jgi:hypothetical protein
MVDEVPKDRQMVVWFRPFVGRAVAVIIFDILIVQNKSFKQVVETFRLPVVFRGKVLVIVRPTPEALSSSSLSSSLCVGTVYIE